MRNASALLPLSELFQTPDAAAGGTSGASGGATGGGGASSGSGSGAGTQSGFAPSGSASSGGGGAPAHIPLTADSMVILPGSNTPVKWGDYQSQHIPLDRHNNEKASAVAAALKAIAAANKNRRPASTQAQAQPQVQPQDFFADVRNLPFIDGATLTQLAERIQREGVNPLYEYVNKLNPFLEQLIKRVQATEGVAGGYQEQQQAMQFESKVKGVLDGVSRKLLPGVDISQHPVLNEFAQDVYLSYNPNDPNLEREYPGILETRLDGLLKLANALNTAKLQQAREARKNFLRPGGGGQPSGQGGAPRLSHRDIARNYFAENAASRT